MQDAQNALKKYMFYWSRFDNHAKSIRFAEKTKKAVEEKMIQRTSGETRDELRTEPLAFVLTLLMFTVPSIYMFNFSPSVQALKGTNLLDVHFLVEASDCVIDNKRILQWLYVYGE